MLDVKGRWVRTLGCILLVVSVFRMELELEVGRGARMQDRLTKPHAFHCFPVRPSHYF